MFPQCLPWLSVTLLTGVVWGLRQRFFHLPFVNLFAGVAGGLVWEGDFLEGN